MNEPIRQHYIPRSYLKYFATNENGNYYVDVYDWRRKVSLKKQNISNICFKKDLYTLDMEDKEKKYFLEKFYASHVDSNFTEIHDILTNPDIHTISREQKDKIVVSLLSLYFRTTKFLHSSFELFERAIEDVMNYKPDEENLSFIFDNKRYKFKRSKVEDFKAKIKEEFRLSYISSQVQMWQEFYEKKLNNGICVYKVPEDYKLITSDNPVIIGSYIEGTRFNLNDETNIIQVPIDQQHFLFILPDVDDESPYTIVRANRDKWFAMTSNAQMEKLSERWIISELGGIEKHLAQMEQHSEHSPEMIAHLEKTKLKYEYFKKIDEAFNKNGGNMLAPEVIKLYDDFSKLELFKDDEEFQKTCNKLKNL